jgi:deoxyribodipyrimidine photolyase-related protein
MSNILLILFPTQLFDEKYIKKIFSRVEESDTANIKSSHIILWEHPYFFTRYFYHKFKLIFHRATMCNYFDLIKPIYKKKYIGYTEGKDVLTYIKTNKIDEVRFFNPIEKDLFELISSNKIISNLANSLIFPTPYFLNSTEFETNNQINDQLTSLRHDLFYKIQRIKYNIMVKEKAGKMIPDGNAWSFDKENRSKFEKTQQEPPILNLKSKDRQGYLVEAVEYVQKHFAKNYGESNLDNFIYPINRSEAIKWLDYFVAHRLEKFGKFEDALSSKIKFGYHSMLSAMTNIGLITPFDIIKKVRDYKTNIESKEGFIRQVIGWREYSYFTYDLYAKSLETTTIYTQNKHKIPEKVWACKTQIPYIDNILRNVTSNAYSHHIERLMGIGNFLILIGVNIDEIYMWFQTMYIDAYDVFMVPNVYGMLGYGILKDKMHMMTRPYFCSSNYIIKMSDYKSAECVEINKQMYNWASIMDALYWSNIHKYSSVLKKIYSTSSAVSKWDSFTAGKKKEITELSALYIKWIHSSSK